MLASLKPRARDPVPASSRTRSSADHEPRRCVPANRPRGSSERAVSSYRPTISCPAAPETLAAPMLVSVFGTPSALTYWGIHLLRTIMQVVYGDFHFIPGVYVEDLRQAGLNAANEALWSFPNARNRLSLDLIIKSGAPIFAFADDPARRCR